VAERCHLFEDFMLELLEREPGALPFSEQSLGVAIHGHCHAKALTDVGAAERLMEKVPGAEAKLIDSGCCGMAGAFGLLREHREVSREVAAPLVEAVRALPPGTRVVASGTSCRHQLEDLVGTRPLHMAEVLAQALRPKPLTALRSEIASRDVRDLDERPGR
jgi:Fe-S oxidoreductase